MDSDELVQEALYKGIYHDADEAYESIDRDGGEYIQTNLIDYYYDEYKNSPLSYYEELYDGDSLSDFIITNELLDLDKIADSILKTDGLGPSLATYDSETLYLPNDYLAFRIE